MSKERVYRGPLADYINGLIASKRACGYIYDLEAYILERFDKFCIEFDHNEPTVSRELMAAWAEKRPTEGESHRSHRISIVRQLSLYMCSIGIDAYIPRGFTSSETPVPYILSREEARALFDVIDGYGSKSLKRMADGYRIAFRLMYCCGLRISECSKLKIADIDFKTGSLFLRHSKGDKDRIVSMANDMAIMATGYRDSLIANLGFIPEWFFPGRDPARPISKGTYCIKFQQMWSKVPGTGSHQKRPTPHALRHAFVVNRMNIWMAEGRNLESMMPYLAAYLGHSGPSETFYYYHQVQEAFAIVRKRDEISGRVIPEVMNYGK